MNGKTKRITTIGMLCAVAYVATFIGRVPLLPVVGFLKYDPKDIIISIGGFIFGPMTAFLVSLVVSLVEMFTVSDTGIYGLIMNVIASCSFACIAAFVYKRMRNLKGAVIGLLCGLLCMLTAMLLWNYIITPLFMNVAREEIVKLLFTAILPFNLIKGGLNAALTMFLYKPVVSALRRTNLIESEKMGTGARINIGVMLVSALIIITCVLLVLSFNGVL